MKKKIIIVAGDPNSINSEIISKTWRAVNTSIKRKIYLIGNFNLINKQFNKLKRKVSIIKVKQLEDMTFISAFRFLQNYTQHDPV